MTFAVLGTDGDGRFGMAVSSSSPAVAARCIHLRPGVGGAASQNITDPRLGDALLDAVAKLGSAPAALDEVVAATPDVDYRQLMVIDGAGATARFSGAHTLGLHASASGEWVVAAGNLLAAGGEAGPVRSAGLGVVAGVAWRITDLRVDWHDDPIGELERLVALWLPRRDDYLGRALAPAESPSYGVPGDE
jgi:uncharacterized Ntn-hydrolase superfamily protein